MEVPQNVTVTAVIVAVTTVLPSSSLPRHSTV